MPVWPLMLLFFASGLAALIYQVLWTREFGLIFGSTTRAASVVLASFFGGMAIGNLLGGRVARRRGDALFLYGAVELVIAAGGITLFFWLDLYASHYPALYGSALGRGPGLRAIQLGLAFLAMGPPTIAMGATLPLISRAAVSHSEHLGRRVASIYALNTLGATLGVLLSGFILPVLLGTFNSLLLAAAINIAVGLATWIVWAWRYRENEPDRASTTSPEASIKSRTTGRIDPAIYFIVIASGLGTLTLEVLYTRLIAHTSDSSVYSFALMLAVFLVALAIGSLLASAIVDRIESPWRLIAWTSGLGAAAIMLSPRVFALAIDAATLSPLTAGAGYLGRLALFAALTIGPGVVLIGIALPTAWRIASRDAAEAGRQIGRLTAANTSAGVVGSLAAGFWLLPTIGLGAAFAVVALVFTALSLAAWVRGVEGRRRWLYCGATTVLVGSLALAGSWRVMPLGLRSGERIIHYHDGESGTVAVTENAQGVRQLRINNRYGLATSSRRDVRRQRNEGRLGLLLADRPKSAAFIGIATGISLSSIEHFASLERIVAMELIPGVIDATSFFEEANLGVMHDPRLTIVVADARNHLYASGERFDVVVGDLFVPWHAGTGYLYTAEHFSLVADRLQPGGVFVQWLQGSIISIEEVKIIAATFADAFPEAQLWRVRDTAWLAFVGHATPDDVDPAIRIDDPRFGDFELICAGETLRHWTQGSLRNTDDYPIIEFWTAATHLADRPEAERRIHRTLRRLRAKWEREKEREGGLAPAQGSARPVGSGSSAALQSPRNPIQTKS